MGIVGNEEEIDFLLDPLFYSIYKDLLWKKNYCIFKGIKACQLMRNTSDVDKRYAREGVIKNWNSKENKRISI